jgi:tetratricopeptide (TPR) repeat protein
MGAKFVTNAASESEKAFQRSVTPLAFSLSLSYLSADWLFAPMDVPAPDQDEFDIQFCEDIIVRNPRYAEVLTILGDAYTKNGKYMLGLEVDLLLAKLKPNNQTVNYNLACSYALTGQKEEAFLALEKAIHCGYDDLEHLCKDKDLDNLKTDPRFKKLAEALARKYKTDGIEA